MQDNKVYAGIALYHAMQSRGSGGLSRTDGHAATHAKLNPAWLPTR